MSTIRVKAAVVDVKKLLLYKEDGTTISIPQGDPRIKSLVDQIVPLVNRGEIAEVDLQIDNQYRDFEQAQEGTGFVRFFRTARNKLGGLFKTEEADELPTGVFGEIPVVKDLNTAIEEILAHAQPVNTTEFSPGDTGPDQTIVAVFETDQGKAIIPGVEALKDILAHSAKNRHTIGVQNLLKRMAGYIKDRQHSVEDLLRFLEKGDLPIADDGSIVAYKRLYSTDELGTFVDPHTRKVKQRVGSYVCVSEELVDKNRRNECSNGLHIGRRAYMGSFSGDAIMLCKIAPEDVIVVPHGDPNKVRVCGYHILARLPVKAFEQIKKNRPMTEIEGIGDLLGKVLAGQHVDVLERVEITGQRGEGVIITPTGAVRQTGANRAKTKASATAIDDKRNKRPEQEPSSVDVKQLAASVSGSRQQRAQELFAIVNIEGNFRTGMAKRIQAAKDLIAFKKRVKISWDKLGLSKQMVAMVLNIAETPVPTPKPAPKPKATKKPVKASKRSTAAPRASNPAKVAEALVKDVPTPASQVLTKGQQARQLHDSMLSNHLNAAQQAVLARQLLDLRRKWKKSWAGLGMSDVTDEDLKKVINAAPIDVPHTDPVVAKVAKAKKKTVKVDAIPEPTGSTFDTHPDELALSPERKAALALKRGGQTTSAASKQSGVHRRTIDRDFERFGK